MLARTVSSLIFFAIFLFGLYGRVDWAPHIVFVIVMASTLWGTREYYKMAKKLKVRPSPWPGMAVATAFLIDAYFFMFENFVYIFITCFWALFITQVFIKRYDRALINNAVSLFGSIYLGLPMAICLDIFRHASIKWGYDYDHAGSNLLIFLLVASWATDIGGYCIGKPFGKRKLSPVLSPNKSMEGLFGGLGLAAISGLLLWWLFPHMDTVLSWPEALLLPVLFTLVGTVGDLAESAFKRDAGVKDSGETYTGHGGMLDIVDSLLLCAPVFYLYLKIMH